ncbi:hypothetical protein EJ03DRAFT_325245 [Teratosphaeria nubilosa]|uniref:F-box domain-containing protein n=1 Tax=Teratosphaeria nubilosa TaxID=161662 RepID=A0A6G1LFD0_9PEZI|nr:hypothetical protein EJ03DRAFT_325245 [Teratosphaeria nubilosa]
MAGTKRRSTRQAATRKRSIYYEPDSDDDFDISSEDDFAPEEPRHDSTAEALLVDEAAPPPPQKRRKIAPRQSRPQTRSKSDGAKSRKRNTDKLKPLAAPKKKAHVDKAEDVEQKAFAGPTDGTSPPWTELPLDILQLIFHYASHPLHENTRTASHNAAWLIKAARTCRKFAQPALEAFYRAPPIHNQNHPHDLLALLQTPPESRSMDHKVKVKALAIDVNRLAYTAHGRPLFDLSTLVAELPLLQHLELLHPLDQAPFRGYHVARSWHYPPDLFSTLEQHAHKLKTWRWHRDMVGTRHSAELYSHMAQVHSGNAFKYLTKLTICRFNHDNDSAEPEAEPSEDTVAVAAPGLATSITLLPSLTDLTFISCDVLMDKFLERLPKNLERLEITNCLELTSPMLLAYLAVGGSHLRELVLNHNAALNLSFLSDLKARCPRLEVLKVDLRYYSERMNSNDAEPLYDAVLAEDDQPTWPPSLNHIQIEHPQRWTQTAAENLFRSLVDSAEDLPNLRTLILQTHINVAWRERAGFRDQWIERLQRVYLQKSPPPNPYLGSKRQHRLYKQALAHGRALPQDPAEIAGGFDSEDEVVTGARVSHIEVSSAKSHSGHTDIFSDSSLEEKKKPRRSARVAESQSAPSPSDPSTPSSSDDDDESADGGDAWRRKPEKFIQGCCAVVDVRIDNQRPREHQFTEADFRDAVESEEDEDWHEGIQEEGVGWGD